MMVDLLLFICFVVWMLIILCKLLLFFFEGIRFVVNLLLGNVFFVSLKVVFNMVIGLVGG